MEKITENWKESGLLEGLSDEKAEELAFFLDKAAKYLINLKPEQDNKAAYIFLPILRRIYTGVDKVGKFGMFVDVVELFDDLSEKFVEFFGGEEKIAEIHAEFYYFIDAEAKFCAEYSERYVEDLKKRKII